MTGIVPPLRPEPDSGAHKIGAAVASTTWQGLGALGNWLRGKGSALVPACTPRIDIPVGTGETFRFRAKTRSSAIQRVWVIYLRTLANRAAQVEIRAPAASGVVRVASTGPSDLRNPIVYVENLASRSATEQQVDIEIYVDTVSSGEVYVESIACYEQDRSVLQSDATDYGVDLFSLASGQPIYDPPYASIGGVYDILTHSDARRVGIFQWSQGDSSGFVADGFSTSLLSLPVPVLVRKLARTATTGSVRWSAYARVSAGTGTITLTHTNSAGTFLSAVDITGTSFAWSPAQTVAGFDCDNLSAADGRRASAWDMLNFTVEAAGGNLLIRSISVWQDD